MDGKKWQDRWIGPVRETLSKLSPAQRLSLGLLGASLLVGLGTLALGGTPGEETILVPIADAQAQNDLEAFLSEEGIDFDRTPGGISMRSSDIPVAQLRSNLAHADGNRPDYYQYIDEAASLTETNRVRAERWGRATKREVEHVLGRCAGIREATVTYTPSRRRTAIARREDPSATAAVILTIDETRYPERRLPATVARVIGQHVAATLGLNLRNVSVMDNYGFGYDTSAAAALGGVENPERHIRAKLNDLVEQTFPAGTYVVVVDVKQNQRPSAIVEESVDPDNKISAPTRKVTEKATNSTSAASPGVKPNVARLGEAAISPSVADEYERTETDIENAFGRKEVRTEVPPGEIEGVTVSLEVDLETAVTILKEEQRIKGNPDWDATGEALDTELERFRTLWRTKLEQHSSLEPERVKAQVDYSVRPRSSDTAAAGTGGSGMLAWAGEHAVSLVLIILSLTGGFFLVRAARGGVPAVEEFPDPVAELEQFLKRREERIAAEVAEREEEERTRAEQEPWSVEDSDQDALELLEEVLRYAQEQPEVASSVVKQWLREPRDARPSGGGAS